MSRRWDTDENSLSALRANLLDQGVRLRALTDTNPTQHGLFDEQALRIIAAHLDRAATYAPDPRGSRRARSALAARFGGTADDYWLTASTSEAYSWLFALLCDPGDRIAIPRPGYPLIEPLARLAGVQVETYPAYYLHPVGWEYDLDAIAATLDHIKALIVVNPNNPTGNYVDAATTTALYELCRSHQVALIADEVFWPFGSGEYPRISGNTQTATFGLDGLSKLLAAPQLKLGWIRYSAPVPDPRVAEVLDRIADSYLSSGAVVAEALPELLELASASSARINHRLQQNLRIAQRVFTAPLRLRQQSGGWILLLDVPPVASEDELVAGLLQHAHLDVQPGWFYDLGDGPTLVLSLLPPPEHFEQNCGALRAGLAEFGV